MIEVVGVDAGFRPSPLRPSCQLVCLLVGNCYVDIPVGLGTDRWVAHKPANTPAPPFPSESSYPRTTVQATKALATVSVVAVTPPAGPAARGPESDASEVIRPVPVPYAVERTL